jgi:methionine-rich copper-binding protein CopC
MVRHFLILVMMAPLTALTLFAHAVLVEAMPTRHTIVSGPNVVIRLRFNSRIDVARSRLTVILLDHQKTVSVAIDPASSTLDVLEARASGLRAGTCVLRWQVQSVDGHVTRGEVPFEVK